MRSYNAFLQSEAWKHSTEEPDTMSVRGMLIAAALAVVLTGEIHDRWKTFHPPAVDLHPSHDAMAPGSHFQWI